MRLKIFRKMFLNLYKYYQNEKKIRVKINFSEN